MASAKSAAAIKKRRHIEKEAAAAAAAGADDCPDEEDNAPEPPAKSQRTSSPSPGTHHGDSDDSEPSHRSTPSPVTKCRPSSSQKTPVAKKSGKKAVTKIANPTEKSEADLLFDSG